MYIKIEVIVWRYVMRIIQSFRFQTANKIPFSQLPEIVHRFLSEQKLSSKSFLYFLECIDEEARAMNRMAYWNANPDIKKFIQQHQPSAIEEYQRIIDNPPVSPVDRAVKDCPKLGAVKSYTPVDESLGSATLYLSNIITPTECTEEDLKPFFKRMERTYGLSEVDLYYCDIDFFGYAIPYERDLSRIKKRSEALNYPFDETEMLESQPYGSMISIQRINAGIPRWNNMTMSIDILRDGQYCDPSPYYEAMKALLSSIKSETSLNIYLNDAEKARVLTKESEAVPLLEECSAFLLGRLTAAERQTRHQCNYSLAPKLKKLSKENGYSYAFVWSGVFSMKKRLKRGHYLRIIVTSGPSHYDSTFHLHFDGLGFSHELANVMCAPTDQSEFDACAESFFEAVRECENLYAAKLDRLYDPSPEWFFPND